MKKITLSLFLACLFLSAFANKTDKNAYQYFVDINNVVDDKIHIELTVPKLDIKKNKLTFHMPKIVPGTYAIYDFGRFVSNFKALTKSGKELKVKHTDANTWVIKKAKKLHKIVYTVEDTWDRWDGFKSEGDEPNVVFEPGGTNFEKELNFVFNNHTLFGYFAGHTRKDYLINVKRPANFYGATSMKRVGGTNDSDVFHAGSYNDLVDAPIMFCKPDTAIIQIGNAAVEISTYSPNGKVDSKFLASQIGPILNAQKDYLGGELPVDRYSFIIYLFEGFTLSGGYGALEHSYSSLYCLPEYGPEEIAQMVRDVAAHEFFHIVTPLNIHSKEIHDFDFIDPKMSEHLWLYEGVTEYSSGHVQVRAGMLSIEKYLDVLSGKVRGAARYTQDVSFTEMSKNVLNKYKDDYTNVYEKGALIGLCIDLKLNILSNGTKNLRGLMNELSKEYGIDKPFEDKELFDKITALTFPEMKAFFSDYVAGTKALPLVDLLGKAGVEYAPVKMVKEKTLGFEMEHLQIAGDKLGIRKTEGMDAFGKAIGFKVEDVITHWNGQELTILTVDKVLTDYFMNSKVGDDLEVKVLRNGAETVLKTKVIEVEKEKEHVFSVLENPSAEQMKLRKAWLGDYVLEADAARE